MSLWSRVLFAELAVDQTVLSAIQTAEPKDKVGPGAVKPFITLENPQWTSGSGGEEIKLADPEATVRHAVIWGGRNGYRRHYENMAAMRELLISKWGSPSASVTIAMFYGDGAHGPGGLTFPEEWGMRAATDEGLRQYFWTLRPTMSPTTQFFFYATGHGASGSALPAPTKFLNQGITESEEFSLTPAELWMLGNETDNEPAIFITYEGFTALTGEVSVSLNGALLGTIPPSADAGEATAEFAVPESLLAAENTISLYNGSDAVFTQVEIEYHFGDISDDPPRLVCDYDGDGDVDSSDFATFQLCHSGPAISYMQAMPEGCPLLPDVNQFIPADFDRDFDVDQHDFGLIQRCGSEADVLADPNCLW